MGIIIDGVYYPKGNLSKVQARQQSTWKQHDHDRQRSDHAAELVQPFTRNGKPNEKFIEAMPEEAKRYGFLPTDEQLMKG